MFNNVLTGIIIAYFSIIIFAGIEKLIENTENNDQEVE